jgi:hypothetical protein
MLSIGNEAEYVIISVVRTTGPGFLSSQNRVNVMLTRCKAGMVIVTNKIFLRTGAQYTLLGRLAQYWAKHHGESNTWTDWKQIVEMKANMPGARGPRSGRNIPPTNGAAMKAPTLTVTNVLAPTGLRPPASQLKGIEPKLRTLSLEQDDFPALGGNGGFNHVAQGRWNSPDRLHAVKSVTAGSSPHYSSGSVDRLTGSPKRRFHHHSPGRGRRKK